MPPQQPIAPAPPAGQFDFILQDPQQPKRNLVPGGKRQFLALGAIGAVIVILLIIIGSLLFGGKKNASTEIISAISQEQELARVSDLASTKATDPNTRAMAATVSAVFNSDAQNLKAYLKGIGIKPSTKQLLSSSKKANDTTLNNASEENHFDSVYLNLIASNLKPYQASLTAANNASKSKNKPNFSAAFTNAQILGASQLFTSANN